MPFQFASLCDGQVFVWSDCLLDLATDFLVGDIGFVWDALYLAAASHFYGSYSSLKVHDEVFVRANNLPAIRKGSASVISWNCKKCSCRSKTVSTLAMLLSSVLSWRVSHGWNPRTCRYLQLLTASSFYLCWWHRHIDSLAVKKELTKLVERLDKTFTAHGKRDQCREDQVDDKQHQWHQHRDQIKWAVYNEVLNHWLCELCDWKKKKISLKFSSCSLLYWTNSVQTVSWYWNLSRNCMVNYTNTFPSGGTTPVTLETDLCRS